MPYHGIVTAANPKKDLTYLTLEFQQIQAHFNQVLDVVTVTANLNATEGGVFNAFLSNADIRFLHFSGHAGDGDLLMDDGLLSRGNILAGMIRYARHLNFVFLNGCATYELVDKFLEYGAGLVIATKAPVFDKAACQFSDVFYQHLCGGRSIGKAFDLARQDLIESLQKGEAGTLDAKQREMMALIEKEDTARTISKGKKDGTDAFQWAMYHKEGSTDAEKLARENWKLVDEGELSPIDHPEPSFHLLDTLSQCISSLKSGLKANDPHLPAFNIIEGHAGRAEDWKAAETTNLINALQNALLTPLAEPFRQLVIYSKDNQEKLQNPDMAMCKELLNLQVTLYNKFIRTAVQIMLSDFVETTILVWQSRNRPLKDQYNKLLSKHHVSKLINEILDGQKNLTDIEFDIYLMRSIVAFLAEGRALASDNTKRAFRQFIEEYIIDMPVMELALNNSMHEVAIGIVDKYAEGNIEQSTRDNLLCYCDRMESALIDLFKTHKYVLLYEILTVGKVEASKRRERSFNIMNHDIFAFSGSLNAEDTTSYGDEFAENYSVLVVSHRKNFLKYLSLSPFIINVSQFFEMGGFALYYFNSIKGDFIEFVDIETGKFIIRINTKTDIEQVKKVEDKSFLGFVPNDIPARNNDVKRLARGRFARVRDQFEKMTYLYLFLAKTKKPRKSNTISQ